eukprot:gene2414-1517_t
MYLRVMVGLVFDLRSGLTHLRCGIVVLLVSGMKRVAYYGYVICGCVGGMSAIAVYVVAGLCVILMLAGWGCLHVLWVCAFGFVLMELFVDSFGDYNIFGLAMYAGNCLMGVLCCMLVFVTSCGFATVWGGGIDLMSPKVWMQGFTHCIVKCKLQSVVFACFEVIVGLVAQIMKPQCLVVVGKVLRWIMLTLLECLVGFYKRIVLVVVSLLILMTWIYGDLYLFTCLRNFELVANRFGVGVVCGSDMHNVVRLCACELIDVAELLGDGDSDSCYEVRDLLVLAWDAGLLYAYNLCDNFRITILLLVCVMISGYVIIWWVWRESLLQYITYKITRYDVMVCCCDCCGLDALFAMSYWYVPGVLALVGCIVDSAFPEGLTGSLRVDVSSWFWVDTLCLGVVGNYEYGLDCITYVIWMFTRIGLSLSGGLLICFTVIELIDCGKLGVGFVVLMWLRLRYFIVCVRPLECLLSIWFTMGVVHVLGRDMWRCCMGCCLSFLNFIVVVVGELHCMMIVVYVLLCFVMLSCRPNNFYSLEGMRCCATILGSYNLIMASFTSVIGTWLYMFEWVYVVSYIGVWVLALSGHMVYLVNVVGCWNCGMIPGFQFWIFWLDGLVVVLTVGATSVSCGVLGHGLDYGRFSWWDWFGCKLAFFVWMLDTDDSYIQGRDTGFTQLSVCVVVSLLDMGVGFIMCLQGIHMYFVCLHEFGLRFEVNPVRTPVSTGFGCLIGLVAPYFDVETGVGGMWESFW